ncbi:MAG TPA: SdrD B-like domain-containing protein [Gemmata sp.]|nr:SdrD B-like domain-containing protein [Gemmata sp.]
MSVAKRSQLHAELLNDRIVPSVTVLDLSTSGAVATAPSGAIVEQIDPQPTGTGYVQAFVRIQGKNGGIEQGYNTDARPLQFDEKSSPEFTHSITLGQVPIVTVDGVNYLEFSLGVNQKASSPYLSLDEVQIFLGSAGNLTGYDPSTNTLAGLSPLFDINSNGAVSVKLNANLSSGNGSGDMALLVPDAAFVGSNPNSYLYLYSKFGEQPGETSNGGFEQWWLPPAQPAPALGSLSGSVIVAGSTMPIPGVTIQLQGKDSQGNPVSASTTTGMNGNFTFTNLPAGTYSIMQVVPAGYIAVSEMVGTVNGVSDGTPDQTNTQITAITISAGQNGIGYIFEDTQAE